MAKEKQDLFPKFGEMGTAKELNLCADGFREEGDIESLKAFAEENGFDEQYVNFWLEDREKRIDAEFCDPITAAIGKLEVEKKANKELGVFADDIIDYLTSGLNDMNLAKGIRANGKRLAEAADLIYKEAVKNTVKIGGRSGNYCGPMKGFRLIKEYYTGGGKGA